MEALQTIIQIAVLIAWAGAVALGVYVISLLSRLVRAVEKIAAQLEKSNIETDGINF
ncbi:MAG TPA: hypothetical protein VHO28_15710 [Ignavibacteriales bacterium]|nr:hypothetical protein [Ignavibacteriales bacterium]